MDYEDAKAVMWLGLAALFVLAGGGAAYASWRLGRVLRGVEVDLHRTVDEIVPVIVKTGTSVDHVNDHLAKVDIMLDSAVSMTEAVDTTVRAVSIAITEPVRLVSGAIAGVTEAIASFHDRLGGDGSRGWRDAAAGAADVATPSTADADDPARASEQAT